MSLDNQNRQNKHLILGEPNMKSKKWLIAGIISIILVLAEAAAMFLFVLPGMNKNKMIEALEEGDGAAAADYYDKVNLLRILNWKFSILNRAIIFYLKLSIKEARLMQEEIHFNEGIRVTNLPYLICRSAIP